MLNYSVSIYHQQWCSNASGEQIRTDDSIGARRFCAIRRREELPFPLGFTVDGKRYEKMVPGRVARVFAEESRVTEQSYSREESSHIFRTAFLLFAGYVDAATTFAQNCGGGGSVPDQNWGRNKNEDDILWARRCFRKAREMVTTPVIRSGMRR